MKGTIAVSKGTETYGDLPEFVKAFVEAIDETGVTFVCDSTGTSKKIQDYFDSHGWRYWPHEQR